jgi:hypothetical protein
MKNTRKKRCRKGGNNLMRHNNYTSTRGLHLGRKTRKVNSKKVKSKKMKGGQQVYGRGYGANCYDPNFSIYTTNELKLFPYKPK